MPYGTIKVDTITFTDGGVDKSVAISGLVQNPTFTGNVTVTGTVSGATVRATTISGLTISGTTINAASGVFTTQISGAVVVAPAGLVGTPSVQVGTGATVAPGLYGAGTDQLGVSTGGSSRLVVDSVGQIRIVTLGSAAAPALVVGNDLNTGLYSPGADQVAISTAGTGRLFVDASGNVGIGTSSPNRLFESSAATVDNFARINTTGATKSGVEFANGGAVYSQLYFNNVAPYDLSLFQQYSTGSLILGTNNTERARIDSSGRVGIGTTSPGARLDILGTTPSLHISDNTGGTPDYRGYTLDLSARQQTGGINFLMSSPSAFLDLYAGGSAANLGGWDGQIRFFTGGINSYGTERLRITSDGKVGIGASSPASTLDAAGDVSITGNENYLYLYSTYTVGSNSRVRIRAVGAGGGSGYGGDFRVSTRTSSNTWNTDAFVVDNTGKVGIGTTSPIYALDVQGSQGVGLQIFENSSGNNRRLRITQESSGVTYDATYSLNGNTHRWLIGGGETMRLDANGRLLVGTSSSRFYTSLGDVRLQVEGTSFPNSSIGVTNNQATVDGAYIALAKTRGIAVGSFTSVQNGDLLGSIWFQGADGTALVRGGVIECVVDGTPGTSDMPGRLVFSTTADGASTPTERMRIGNNGATNVFASNANGVGAISNLAAGATYYLFYGANNGTSTTSGTTCFLVYINGDVRNTNNSYAGISDIKLKENIIDASSQWDDIKALRPVNYNFKSETGAEQHKQLGLIAQEVELVSPGLVTESPDRDAEGNDLGTVTKSVNYSVLYMKAVKALQEAMERIETLEAKVAALEQS